VLERGAQLVDPIKPLTPLIGSDAASAETQSLGHSRWIECQRTVDLDHRSVALLPILLAKGVEDQASIHDLQRQASTSRQNPCGFSKNGFVLFLGVEESERVQHHGRVGTPGLQWQPAHVAAKPLRVDVTHLVPDGDRVFVTYEARKADGGRFRNTEILTIRNGQLVDAEVYFGWSIPHAAKPGGFVDKKP
jgi:hypothetical protein